MNVERVRTVLFNEIINFQQNIQMNIFFLSKKAFSPIYQDYLMFTSIIKGITNIICVKTSNNEKKIGISSFLCHDE